MLTKVDGCDWAVHFDDRRETHTDCRFALQRGKKLRASEALLCNERGWIRPWLGLREGKHSV